MVIKPAMDGYFDGSITLFSREITIFGFADTERHNDRDILI